MFSKTLFLTSFSALTIFSMQGLVARSGDYGAQKTTTPTPNIYNLPGRIDTKSWDVYANATFIYWNAIEQGLVVGINVPQSTTVNTPINGGVVEMDFDYKPGVKVGLGLAYEYDNWDNYLEYTYFGANESVSFTAPTTGSVSSTWFARTNNGNANSVSAKWKLRLNLLDFETGRSYYVGSKLIARPFFGLRGTWDQQRLDASYTGTFVVLRTVTSQNKSSSWGVGPRAGLKANWLIGHGFSFLGKAAASLLYTDSKVSHQEPDLSNVTGTDTYFVIQNQENKTFRPNAEFGIGFDWGTYFQSNRYHFDIAATYDFQVFMDQNAMKQAMDTNSRSSLVSTYDLYLHGLTLSARFDF